MVTGRMKQKGIWILLFLILFSSLAYAAETYEVSILPIDYEVTQNEQAAYQISITNNRDSSDSYRLSVPEVSWTVQSNPLYDYFGSMDVAPHAARTTILYVGPASKMPVGQYRIELIITSEKTGVTKQEFLILDLQSPHPVIREYLAAVRKLVDIPSQIDPREGFPIIVNLDNRNPKNISELTIQMSSNLINHVEIVSLGPLEKKTVRYDVKLPDSTAPQEDVLSVALIIDNQTLDPIIKEPFEIKAYSTVTKTEEPMEKTLLKVITGATYYNDGNTGQRFTAEEQVGFFDRLFVRSDPGDAYSVSKQGSQFIAWDFDLGPGESITVTVTRDYTPLFVLAVALVLGVILYYVFRSPITVRKEAVILETREGGVSEIKVLLHIKNRSNRNFEKVTVVDRVSKIGELIKDNEVGVLKPTKLLSHEKEGTIIKWDLGSVERFEERIISYRIHSKLSILGSFYLAPAIIKYVDSFGGQHVNKGNAVRVKI